MREFTTTIRNEFRVIFGDEGVMLILIFAPLIYATIYSLTYGTQVLRDIPIGVVDEDKTPSSRELVNVLDAGANAVIAYEPTDMEDAKRLFFDREIYGIVYIPKGYQHQLLAGNTATVAIYLDASYMLMYRQVFQDMVAGIDTTGADVEFRRMLSNSVQAPTAKAIVEPVKYTSHTLFNPYLGYGSFVMPPVIILIMQQTLLIGICMIGGTRREKYFPMQTPRAENFCAQIFGRVVTYLIIYAALSLYLLGVHYRLFHYPMNGNAWSITIFMGVYITACSFFGIAASTLFRQRETPLMLLLWISIPLLMLSGVSFPSSAIPRYLQWLAAAFPSSFGTRGFVKLQTMGASLRDIFPELRALLLLILAYFTLATLGTRKKQP